MLAVAFSRDGTLLATGGLLFFLQSFATFLWTTDHRSVRLTSHLDLETVFETEEDALALLEACFGRPHRLALGQRLFLALVAGALEGALLGIPSIAVSLQRADTFDFGPAAGRLLDGPIDVVVGNGARLRLLDGEAKLDVRCRVTAALFRGDDDFPGELCEESATLRVVRTLRSFDSRPLGMTRHAVPIA